ncbi:signal peptidase I [Aeromicrobium sp. Leaf350]|uniref:signal peptidase I n=1 Tax=Aeromicrobium sp. Leaf350 TaxID=2876565 RepID=UPI001E33EF25|nr:signal peptidase I [Aeromicrobium sp. Leaf350]
MTMTSTLATAVRRTAIWLTLLAAVALLAVMVVVPRLGGGAPYTVLTGSMEPGLPPGTLVVIRPTDIDDIDVGDVVTFQLVSGERTTVTHRVIGKTLDEEGDPALLTKGDANNAPDDGIVLEEQVRGTLWYSVPYLGHLNVAAVEERALATRVVAVLLLGYAAFAGVGLFRSRRARLRAEAGGPGSHRQKVDA